MTVPTPKITVHWLNNSKAQRILWLLEELSLPYEIIRYSRHPVTHLAPPELLAIHPLGRSPVVTIKEGDEEEFVMSESGAITEFILERYGEGKLQVGGLAGKASAKERANYLFWLHYSEGTTTSPTLMWLIFNRTPAGAPMLDSYVKPTIKKVFSLAETHLSKNTYFAGEEFTGADLMMSFPVHSLLGALSLKDYPNIERWYELVKERPAYKVAEGKGSDIDTTAYLK